MKNKFLPYVAPLILLSSTLTTPLSAEVAMHTPYDLSDVAEIRVQFETEGHHPKRSTILEWMQTKVGDPFSQETFDKDLKALSQRFDRVEPKVTRRDGKIYITLMLWEKPLIRAVRISGNHAYSSSKLKDELDIQSFTEFDRPAFNDGLNKIRDLYTKAGYFESEVSYKLIPHPDTNEVDIEITIHEGSTGYIQGVRIEGLNKEERREILHMIRTKRYNFASSWLTGTGTFNEELLEHDKLIITNHFQNQGYADCYVDIQVTEDTNQKLLIVIDVKKGPLFTFEHISFNGNILYSDYEIQKILPISDNSPFSPEQVREAVEAIKDLYGKDGYIDTNIQYTLHPVPSEHKYDVTFTITEGRQYKIGVVRVIGNSQTHTKVILRESKLVPGELFDSRKLKATQEKLESTGYYKSVNVYPVQTSEDASLGDNYRDVIIEVDEAPTGNLSFFVGASSSQSGSGGIDFSENNFNIAGLGSFWRDGLRVLRGGGEYFALKLSGGYQQADVSATWMTPYLADSLWRVGFDGKYGYNGVVSENYHAQTMGGSVFASYPITQYVSYGVKMRSMWELMYIDDDIGGQLVQDPGVKGKLITQRELLERNSGVIFGLGNNISYNSTDRPMKPHSGIRSTLEVEAAMADRHEKAKELVPFLKLGFVNSIYYPVTTKTTLKFQFDERAIITFDKDNAKLIPMTERFYLGGDQTLRGYKPYIVGEQIENNDGTFSDSPLGGVTSSYFSTELNHEVHSRVDLFGFFDIGSVATQQLTIKKPWTSVGAGVRLDIGRQMPLILGFGQPLTFFSNKEYQKNVQKKFFFTFGGQF